MKLSVEQRVKRLENENKARKADYPVAGSLVRFVSQSSDTYSGVEDNNETLEARIRFTPNIASESGKSLTTLWAQVSTQPDFSTIYPRAFWVNEPQPGDNSIVLRLQISANFEPDTFYFRAISTGPSLGVFTLL